MNNVPLFKLNYFIGDNGEKILVGFMVVSILGGFCYYSNPEKFDFPIDGEWFPIVLHESVNKKEISIKGNPNILSVRKTIDHMKLTYIIALENPFLSFPVQFFEEF